MKTIKARHKLIPAIIMLIVAAITMSTASYAWFTMSNRVEVTGVELSVVAPTNILIREKKSGPTYDNFLNTVSLSTTSLGIAGKLNHASSVNGVDMFTVEDATTMVNTNGTLTSTATIISTTTPVATDDGYYVDFFLELVNTGEELVTVGLDKLTIAGVDDSAAEQNIEGAVRFAILDGSASKGVFGQGEGTTVVAFSAAGAPGTTANQTVLTTSDNLFTLEGGGVADTSASPAGMKSITVRVWIEGQDPDCVSAKAGSSFSIEFNFYVVE
jgi:hypothetical protein